MINIDVLKEIEITKENAKDIYIGVNGYINAWHRPEPSYYDVRKSKGFKILKEYLAKGNNSNVTLGEILETYSSEKKEQQQTVKYEGRNLLEEIKSFGFTNDDFLSWNEIIFENIFSNGLKGKEFTSYKDLTIEEFRESKLYSLFYDSLVIYHKNKELYSNAIDLLSEILGKHAQELSENYRINNPMYDPNSFYDLFEIIFCVELKQNKYLFGCPYYEKPYSIKYFLNNEHANILDAFESLGFLDLKERYQQEIIDKYKKLFFKS